MKYKYFFIIFGLFAAYDLHGQTKDQQKIFERIVTDQKRWQQSKMPTYTVHNKNYSWQVPFPGQRYYQGGGLLSYPNSSVPRPVKSNITFNLTYPKAAIRDSLNGIRTYVRFK